MAEKVSPGLQPLGLRYMSIEEVAFITGGLGHLYWLATPRLTSAGAMPAGWWASSSQ